MDSATVGPTPLPHSLSANFVHFADEKTEAYQNWHLHWVTRWQAAEQRSRNKCPLFHQILEQRQESRLAGWKRTRMASPEPRLSAWVWFSEPADGPHLGSSSPRLRTGQVVGLGVRAVRGGKDTPGGGWGCAPGSLSPSQTPLPSMPLPFLPPATPKSLSRWGHSTAHDSIR